jgi:hypothetical protein
MLNPIRFLKLYSNNKQTINNLRFYFIKNHFLLSVNFQFLVKAKYGFAYQR